MQCSDLAVPTLKEFSALTFRQVVVGKKVVLQQVLFWGVVLYILPFCVLLPCVLNNKH